LIKFKDNSFQAVPDESVLECLLRNGEFVPNGCRSGICHSCLMRATQGNPSAESQKGLKPTQIEKNMFCSCMCVPDGDMEVEFPGAQVYRAETKVISVEPFNDQIYRLRLERPTDYVYRAGQYLTVYNDKGDGRNYSLASLPDRDDFLELHIRLLPGGKVSPWVCKNLHAGDLVTIGESLGECVYEENEPERPLLLIGTGSGAAPLIGIVRQALSNNHTGEIIMYQGSSNLNGLYLHNELRALADKNDNFRYNASISDYKPMYKEREIEEGRASEKAAEENPDLMGWRVYICGNPEMVKNASRTMFLKGASLKNIHADPFVHPKTAVA